MSNEKGNACYYFLYNDDSSILVAGKNKSQIETVVISELKTVSQWLFVTSNL